MFQLDLWEKAAECQRALEGAESNQRQILTDVRDLWIGLANAKPFLTEAESDRQVQEINRCPFRKLYPDVMVVQPGQNWDSDNGAGPLDYPTCGRVFAQRQVRAHLIVVGRIRRKNLPQVRLA